MDDFHRYIFVLSVSRVKEIVITLFFVDDLGWLRHFGVRRIIEALHSLCFFIYRRGIFFSHLIIYFRYRMSDSCAPRKDNWQTESDISIRNCLNSKITLPIPLYKLLLFTEQFFEIFKGIKFLDSSV